MNVAIYAKDVKDDEFKDLRDWVESQGFTHIVEYRDVTPARGRSGDKKLGEMLQDAKAGNFKILFINSLRQSGSIGTAGLTVLLALCIFRSHGVRLISREEPWTDLSVEELGLLHRAYFDHQESEAQMTRRKMRRRVQSPKNNKRKPSFAKYIWKWVRKYLNRRRKTNV